MRVSCDEPSGEEPENNNDNRHWSALPERNLASPILGEVSRRADVAWVFLAGEGPTDLGDWARLPQYREDPPCPGVIEALLRRRAEHPIEVVGGITWKRIRKYKAGDHRRPETRTVLGLMLHAEDAAAEIVAFTRDRDGDPEREQEISRGIAEAEKRFDPGVIGGMAIEELEAWILAMLGEHGSERLTDPKAKLQREHGISGRDSLVGVALQTDLDSLPHDARSLRAWLQQATYALAVTRETR